MHVEEVADGDLVVVEKRLTPRERSAPEPALRLRAEARLLALLGGRVTPRLVAAGDDERGPFVRTEKLPFGTLADRLERGAPMDAAWIERAARAAFAAMAELHDAADDAGPLGVVHADLSPSNVAIDEGASRCVILDLGLALFRGGPVFARDGAFRGTAVYAAPEVARGAPASARSDLFSLAATLLHAATGTAPRGGPSLAAVLARAGDEPVLDPGRRRLAALGPGHAAIVACLAHAPGDRPASAREVLSRLRRLP